MTISSDIFKYAILMNLTDTIEAEKAKKESRIKLEIYINKRWGEKEITILRAANRKTIYK